VTKVEAIRTDRAPAAVGPYSQGIRFGDLLFTSGQLPVEEGKLIATDIERATRCALANVEAILAAGGAALADIVKVTVYLTDMKDFAGMNAVYAETFREPFPARSCVEVSRLPLDAPILIEAVAAVA